MDLNKASETIQYVTVINWQKYKSCIYFSMQYAFQVNILVINIQGHTSSLKSLLCTKYIYYNYLEDMQR